MTLASRIAALPPSLRPLSEAAARCLDSTGVILGDGTLCIGHAPWIAEQAYGFLLYPGIAAETLGRYTSQFGLDVPPEYADFLRAVGGAFCFGMSLCGVPPSMRGDIPLLDRSRLQCHDLATAARHWAAEYRVPEGWFHFGSRDYSRREIVGYFLDRGGNFLCVRRRGKVVGKWPDITSFFADELRSAEDVEGVLHPRP